MCVYKCDVVMGCTCLHVHVHVCALVLGLSYISLLWETTQPENIVHVHVKLFNKVSHFPKCVLSVLRGGGGGVRMYGLVA